MAALLGVLLWMNKVEEDKKSAELQALNKKLYQEERKRQIIMRLDTRLLQPFTSWSNSL
ncbi:hypothetical protein G5B27_15770 [Fusicatenibacter saccharivorans]|nr:hypothetical protein [Fusicatenibacter saccharivorans]